MIRTRLRISTWRNWKRIRTKVVNLIKLGIDKSIARMWGNTSKKPCRIAHGPILMRTLDNKYFRKRGYIGFSNYYFGILMNDYHYSNKPPYTRPVRTVV
jgi:RNA-directed DNA polymerase